MSDNHLQLKCPACQNDMTKVFVPKEGVNVDICLDGCGGMWFDNRELVYFDEQDENIDEILNAISDKTFKQVDESNHRSCPVCGARMVKNYSSVKKNVQIDECYSCGGKFLDNKELEKFRAEYATEEQRSADTINMMYQTVGVEIKGLEQERQELAKSRSPLKKLFDFMIYGQGNNL